MIGKILKMKEQPESLATPSFSLSEHVHSRPELQPDLQALTAAETRLAASTARKQKLSALRRGATAAAPTLSAEQLIAGEREPGWSLDGEIVACENEIQTLRAEITDRAEKIAIIKRDSRSSNMQAVRRRERRQPSRGFARDGGAARRAAEDRRLAYADSCGWLFGERDGVTEPCSMGHLS